MGFIYADCLELDYDACLQNYEYCEWNEEENQCQVIGDINGDYLVNIQDIIIIINLILSNGYNNAADINSDAVINVLDIVELVNIILFIDDAPIYNDNPNMNGQFLDAVLLNRNPDCRAYAIDSNNGNYGSSMISDISSLV